jgi:hypothetical protein
VHVTIAAVLELGLGDVADATPPTRTVWPWPA